MGRRWEEFLEEGALDGETFDFISIEDEVAREIATHEYRGREEDNEDRGPKSRGLEIEAVFAGDDYPEKYEKILAMAEAGGVREFVHPVHGRMKVLVTVARGRHNGDDIVDAATLRLSLKRQGTSSAQVTKTTTSRPAQANRVRTARDNIAIVAEQLSTALSRAQAPQSAAMQLAPAEAVQVATLAADLATTLEDSGELLSAPAIEAKVNAVLTEANVVLATISDYTMPEHRDLSLALVELLDGLRAIGSALLEQKPPLIEDVVDVEMPLMSWVHALYQRRGVSLTEEQLEERVLEIFKLNPTISDPLALPAGFSVKVYAL